MNEHSATEQAYKNGYEKGRADAVKEFAERLKKCVRDIAKIDFQDGYYYLIGEAFFDNIVIEMVGEENDR